MKLKKLSWRYTLAFAWRKRRFIARYTKRYLYPELAQQFFSVLWNTAYHAQRLVVAGKETAAELPITLVVGAAQSGKSTLLAANQYILPESSYLNSDFQPMMGQSMPQYYLTPQQCYIELPQYFLVNESPQNIPYLEQLVRFWYAEGEHKRVKKIIVTIRLSHLFGKEKMPANKQEVFWSSLALLLAHLPGVEILCVVTEMDRLQGFTEFFSDLSIEERQHIFGFELSKQSDFIAEFYERCRALCKRLQQRMWWRCKSEVIVAKRLLVAEFPKQFGVFCDALTEYLAPLQIILQSNQAVKIKTCCFISAMQQGNSFDLLFPDTEQLFIAKPASQSLALLHNKEYFIRGFFKKFLFSSAFARQRLNRSQPKHDHFPIKKLLWGLVVIIVVATFSAVGIVGWNIRHLHQVIEKQPVLAYKILASDFATQNLKALIAYETRALPVPIQNRLLHSSSMKAAVQQGARTYLDQCWQKEVYAFYAQNIVGREPLVLPATQSVSLKDFNALYAPSGLLTRFQQTYLRQPQVQKLLADDQSLIQLYEQLKSLQAMLYPAQQLQLSFILYANPLPHNVHSINFIFAGKGILLKNNVLTSAIFNWPNNEVTQDSGYVIQYPHHLSTTHIYQGVWSWLKLFSVLQWQKIDANNTYWVKSTDDPFSVKINTPVPLNTLPELFQHLLLPEHI